MIGRRVIFFLSLAGICLLLAPLTPSEFRWLNEAAAALAVFWAVAIGVEDVVRLRELRRRGRA